MITSYLVIAVIALVALSVAFAHPHTWAMMGLEARRKYGDEVADQDLRAWMPVVLLLMAALWPLTLVLVTAELLGRRR